MLQFVLHELMEIEGTYFLIQGGQGDSWKELA